MWWLPEGASASEPGRGKKSTFQSGWGQRPCSQELLSAASAQPTLPHPKPAPQCEAGGDP